MAAPRVSLRWQLALWAVVVSLLFAALAFTIATPLLFSAAARTRADDLLPLLGGLLLLAASILALAIYALLVRLVARPAERLLDATERMGTTSGEPPLLGSAGPILGRLGTAFERMGRRLDTEQARTQQQLEELRRVNRELEEARDAMIRQEKMATIGRLSAGVAHEIGNPLAAILGYLEVLRTRPEAQPLGPLLEPMEREARRIDRIVRDLVDFARTPRDAAPRPLDLAPLLEHTLRLVQGQRRFRQVEITLHVAPELSPVRADEHRLQQVLVNLLVNAADAMEGTGAIEIQASRSDQHVALTVEDSGSGIAPEHLSQLFDPFFTTKQAGEGTGLGLSISHALAESFGGTLTAANRPEGGAAFTLRLPVVEVGAATGDAS